MSATKYRHLYWCEDCLGKYARPVVANGRYQAQKIFAQKYGYYTVDCFSRWIRRLPKQHQSFEGNFPTDSLVKDCGIVILSSKACTSDPTELKIIQTYKRFYKKHSDRIFYFKELKKKFLLEEKT